MAASDLQELLELIYAPNAVVHMLIGKAIARAMRGHFIVDAALNVLILGYSVYPYLDVQKLQMKKQKS